jgi:hypothetical protein
MLCGCNHDDSRRNYYTSPNGVWNVEFDFHKQSYNVTHIKNGIKGVQTSRSNHMSENNVFVSFEGDMKVFVFDGLSIGEYGENEKFGTYSSKVNADDKSVPAEMKNHIREIVIQ